MNKKKVHSLRNEFDNYFYFYYYYSKKALLQIIMYDINLHTVINYIEFLTIISHIIVPNIKRNHMEKT